SRDVPGIDATRVTSWVVAHVPGLEAPLELTRLGEGQSNLTFLVRDASGSTVVLRRPPTGDILPSAHDVAREYRVLTGLASQGMPVPHPLALCEDPEVTGAVFYVMEHVDGLVLNTLETAGQLSEAARAEAGASLVRTLARLQSADLEAGGLSQLRRPGSYADRQLRRWRRQWDASKTRDLPLVDELADRLAANTPQEAEITVVHGDF